MKHWSRSKTIWVNAVIAALASFESVTGFLQPYVPVNIYALISITLPIINSVLRVITTKGISK
jgi:hypothetical protein